MPSSSVCASAIVWLLYVIARTVTPPTGLAVAMDVTQTKYPSLCLLAVMPRSVTATTEEVLTQ